MKKFFLSGFAALLLISCSSEDTAPVSEDDLNNQPTEKALNTVSYYNEGNYRPYDVQMFENNKMIIWAHYSEGSLVYRSKFTYNEDGNLSGIIARNPFGYMTFERTLSYDANGRIIAKNDVMYESTENFGYTENTTYTYNTDNSVTEAIISSIQSDEVKVYHFDNAGKLSKITKYGNVMQEIVYEGNNISHIGIYDYFYDNETMVKGKYLTIFSGQFATYSNFLLYNGNPAPEKLSDKYIIKIDQNPENSGDVNYTYKFDEQGYPIEVITGANVSNNLRTVITYK